ncbi:Protein of unknown function [Parasphingorhabdus marina DSM 22363]|uniref:DUF1838 domain-containing protein n=1 Tax=Parasphingorhabdus marina DSM 22363 TaxID=1123272 RepID=A0A1N6EMP1_9SPHN|nr:DUF1838 family protein [Parasphingorhabdus marina]SIN84201.1 Protein of unknown function [Parasphingorhabdus marina DSM 22363]
MSQLLRSLMIMLTAALIIALPVRAETFTPELFERWIDSRIGTGEPVYWYSIGTMRSYPDGKILARMEGYDTARMYWPDPARPLVHQYNRKIYIFRDPETGEVLREVNDVPVEPVAYPYQFISYELKDGAVETFVEQGRGSRKNRIGPGRDITVRMIGDTAVFTAPIYLDFPVGPPKDGIVSRYQAFENYDFFVQPAGSVSRPHQLSWVRYGAAPPWAGGGPSIMHLVTWRVDSFAAVPDSLRSYIVAEAPLWQNPPDNLAEIRRLQEPQQ